MNENDSALREIEALCGMEEFKSFSRRLCRAGERLRQSRLASLPLPELIFTVDSGCGISLHIRLLTELLEQQGLFPFVGEEKYFEWSLENYSSDFDSLLERIRVAGGYYGRFRGVIGLELSGLTEPARDGEEDLCFERLMEYCAMFRGEILFIFVLPRTMAKQKLEPFISSVRSRLPVEIVDMPFPQTEEICAYTERLLQDRGFVVESEASALLGQALDELRALTAFDGYRTVINLADEILWRKLSGESLKIGCIEPEDLDFIPGYIRALSGSTGAPRYRPRVGFFQEHM